MIDEKKENAFWDDLDSLRAMLDEEDQGSSAAEPQREWMPAEPQASVQQPEYGGWQEQPRENWDVPPRAPRREEAPRWQPEPMPREEQPRKAGRGTRAVVIILSIIIALELIAIGFVGVSWFLWMK